MAAYHTAMNLWKYSISAVIELFLNVKQSEHKIPLLLVILYPPHGKKIWKIYLEIAIYLPNSGKTRMQMVFIKE
jgi:hypothetical protein